MRPFGIYGLLGIALAAIIFACNQQPTVSTTRGSGIVECDESIFPVMEFQAGDFHNTYTEATIAARSAEAREAVVNFVNDSIRVIALGRSFNEEEAGILKKANIDYEGYKVALDAIAVIINKQRADSLFRIGLLDSIFSGTQTHWGVGKKSAYHPVAGNVNSSGDEVFRAHIMKGRPFGPSVVRSQKSVDVVDAVAKDPDAIGLVAMSWLQGRENDVRVCRLGGGTYQPDSTVVPGQYYSPAQAHVLRKYYPVWREVYLYTRAVSRDVTYGFIAYVKDRKGQQNFINHGLVPAAQPVRIVGLTSDKVHQ
jgi:phosphate transport system substrate-binding protein